MTCAALVLLAGCVSNDQTRPPKMATVQPAAKEAAAATNAASGVALDEVVHKAEQEEKARHYPEAWALFERWLSAHPDDADRTFDLGYTLYLQACSDPASPEANALRLRAKDLIIRARKLGSSLAELIRYDDAINPDGSDRRQFSVKPEVEALMQRGEQAFNQGKYDVALVNYQAALKLDPQQYHAALFIGDTYFYTKDYWKANTWFARAIEIDPNVETAHRYWGDALMKQGRIEDARDRFIDAFVAQPYLRYTQTALNHFADVTRRSIHHPVIKAWEAKIEPGEKGGNIYIGGNVDPLSLAYSVYRVKWLDDNRAKLFPAGKKVRHCLAEEAYAIRETLKTAHELMAKDPGPIAKWKETIDNYEQLDHDGFLEAYLLYEGADEGIAQDYEEYRDHHRATLSAYLHQVWFEGK